MAVPAPAVKSLERTGHRLLEQARLRVQPQLRERVEGRLTHNRAGAGYHLGWLDGHGRPAKAWAGKAVRPALCFAAAEVAGGRAGEALPEAVAVQLVHDFSVTHDDLIDEDRMRRHRPALWAALGMPTAVLCGDALLSLAFTALTDAGRGGRALARLAEAPVEMIEGEALDVAFERRERVRPGEYTAMAAAKTGALMGCACALGTVAAGGDERRARLMAAFGRHLGVAFQITDDLLGICGRQEVTGKPVGGDIAVRKKTLPILIALASATAEGEELAGLYAHRGELSAEQVARAAHLVGQAGGVRAARQERDRELKLAHAALAETAPAPAGRRNLLALAHLLTHRNS
ncbi:polyprenyl synthetase family protein [Streptomyces albus]|uniref:polyprenyl synthetase family protein n=1 Tax=Streptomyces albus TaxID=1888 RepID=UPI0036F4D729